MSHSLIVFIGSVILAFGAGMKVSASSRFTDYEQACHFLGLFRHRNRFEYRGVVLPMSNIDLPELMEILASVGGVTLGKNKNVSWASPKPKGWEPEWTVEISLAGYQGGGGSRKSLSASAKTAMEAAQALYDRLEDFLHSDEGKLSRQQYVDNYNMYLSRYEGASSHQKHGFDPIRHPGEMYPPAVLRNA